MDKMDNTRCAFISGGEATCTTVHVCRLSAQHTYIQVLHVCSNVNVKLHIHTSSYV